MGTFCCTTLNYVGPTGAVGSRRDVTILDGRRADLPGWDKCGFELIDHTTGVMVWDDDEEVARVHYAEMEQLAQAMTGCDHALVSNHIRRNPKAAARHQDLGPIAFVHSDFASGHADVIRRAYRNGPDQLQAAALARHGLTKHAVEDARRIVVLQFWRNLGPAKMDLPLAWCDARTITPAETRVFTVVDYAGEGGAAFDALAVVAPRDSTKHRWYVFPELTPDEVVAFRTFDSDLAAAGATYFTPHSAFRDPDVPRGHPARSSIELRATCLFT